MSPPDAVGVRSISGSLATRILQAGAIAVVLVATPYKTFELDRFFAPKELVLAVTALLATLLCLSRSARLSIGRTDQLLAAALVLSGVSALFATNPWLAERAAAVFAGGLACFWCARSLSRAGYSRPLVAALAVAGVVGAATALLQAYGVHTDLFSLNRAPGGTFGNRNFMAHASAIALPALVYSTLRAQSRGAYMRWCLGFAVVVTALILSRTRAAWLALLVGGAVLFLAGLVALRTRDGSIALSRLMGLTVVGLLGAGAALAMPNTLDWRSESPYLETAQSIVNYKGGSGRGRLVQYGNSARMALHHPVLGVGPGNWPVIYPRYASDNDPSLGQDGMTANPWPSSDWVTFLSERGVAATLCLALAFAAIVFDAIRGLVSESTTERRVGGAVVLSTLAIVIVVGAFDAVLLLPAPALIAWSLLGALAGPCRERASYALTLPRRLTLGAIALALFGIAGVRSAAQVASMNVASTATKPGDLERASALDPGSFRLHVRVAERYGARGNCAKARPHVTAARSLFPFSPVLRRAAAFCGG